MELSGDSLTCSVCYERMAFPYAPSCGHVLCCTCMYKCVQVHNTCASCRAPVNTIIRIYMGGAWEGTPSAEEKRAIDKLDAFTPSRARAQKPPPVLPAGAAAY